MIFKRNTYLLLLLPLLLLTGCLGLEEAEMVQKEKNLIIQEVFYIGTYDDVKWSTGIIGQTKYDYDSYIRIYNPTDRVMYLDGLCLARTAFGNDLAVDLKGDENFAATHVACDRILQFPGDGKDYPIAPGEFKTITAVAIDHTLTQDELLKKYHFTSDEIKLGDGVKYAESSSRKACNLEFADFEWLSPKMMERVYDLKDENEVPNLKYIFSGFVYMDEDQMMNVANPQFQIPDNRSILLLKLGVKPEELDQPLYWWDYETGHNSSIHHLDLPYHKGPHERGDAHAVKIPNEWIIDAVTICDQSSYKRQRLDDSVDGGYASIRNSSSDSRENYYGYALHRRHDGEEYVDNNNSTIDFEKQPASLLTIQPEPLKFPYIKVSQKRVTIVLGEEPVRMKWTVTPKRSKNRAVTWTSSDETIAVVDEKGYVTPVAVGRCEIVGTLANESTDKCEVTIVQRK